MAKNSQLIGWGHYPLSEEAQALIKKAVKRRAELRRKLRKAGKGAKAPKHAQSVYIGSGLVRLDALIRAARKLDPGKMLEISQYTSMAAHLKLHQPIDETVRVRLKEKSNGEFRYYCNFGVRHRAAQALVADMINAQLTPRPFQYNVKGRGVARAVQQIKKIHASGCTYAIQLDIKGYFDNFNHDAIMQALPIAKDVTEHVAIGRHYKLCQQSLNKEPASLHKVLSEYHLLIAEQGLPQGSACSPAISNFFMSKIKLKLPKGAWLINYVDDFLILAQSPERASKAKNALTSSIEEMAVGTFELLEKSSGSLHSGVEFLGHRFSAQDDGMLSVRVTPANVTKITNRAVQEIEQIKDQLAAVHSTEGMTFDTMSAAVKLASRLLSWVHTFSEADDISEHETELMRYIDTLAKIADLDASEIKAIAKLMPKTDVGPDLS